MCGSESAISPMQFHALHLLVQNAQTVSAGCIEHVIHLSRFACIVLLRGNNVHFRGRAGKTTKHDSFYRGYGRKQDGAYEPECKHIRQSTVYRKRHSRLESLFHAPARCWTSCAGDSTTKAAYAGDFTTKLRLHHEGSSFCIQIQHWRKGSGRSAARKKQWHCPKISKIST